MALRSGIAMRVKLSATGYDRLASIADEYRRILRTHILPANGGKRIVDVRRAIRAPRGGLAIHLPPPSGFAFKSIAIIS